MTDSDYQAARKTCTKCGLDQSIESFSKDRGKRDGRSSHCKKCCSDRLASWLEKNADRNNEARKKYRDSHKSQKKSYDAERRVRLNASLREYDKNRHPSRKAAHNTKCREYYSDNRDDLLAKARLFRSNNRARLNAEARSDKSKIKAKRSRRRAAIKSAIPRWFDRAEVLRIYRECERISSVTDIEHQVDHIVPLRAKTVCGLHWHGNLQVIPKEENLRKSNLTWPDMP